MDKIVAHDIIEKSFNKAFSEESFRVFIHNLLNDFEHKSNVYSGNLIWNDFKDHIRSYKRIGKYIDPSGEALDILIVEVKDVSKLERARTTLRNFVIKHLLNFEKDNALVAFYTKDDNGADWRFSFIKLEYQAELDEKNGKVSIRKKFTPAKRSSFLVGKHEKSYTAKKQLLPILQNIATNPTIEDIETAFSVEKVTDEFFDQYKELFIKLTEHFDNDKLIKSELQQSRIDNVRFTKKLLGQIVFLYFLQKKGWLGVSKYEKWSKGDKTFIQNLYSKAEEGGLNFFKDKLQYLFYEALAKERNDENSYYERFQCRIPFLNGGLFEAEYNWKNTNINIPNSLFRNEEKNSSGDVGTGILDVFDRYNFTIKEGDPLDIEVAIDPEMLGKVFENMLGIKDRKSKGAFYTPRDIVHYMCQESLINYLKNSLNNGVSKDDIEALVREGHYALENDERVANKGETSTYKYHLPESIRDNADIIDQKLSDIKICDPAIGSGAFPVGLLHELVNAMLVIAPHFSEKYRNQKLIKFGLDNVDYVTKSRYTYRLKRHIIQNSIYGVDIDESAIDIARLRLWLSLIVDEDDLDMIETLPNLDYKIVCGNSLVSKYPQNTPINDVFIDFNKKIKERKYNNETIKKLIGDSKVDLELYKKVTNDYLMESSHEQKLVFREFITEIKNAFKTILQDKEKNKLSIARGELQNLEATDVFGNKRGNKKQINDAKRKLIKLEKERDQAIEGEAYENALEWRFEFPNLLDENGDFIGFDIVIGNPPYGVSIKGSYREAVTKKLDKVPDYEIYYYFIELSKQLLKSNGVLSYIIPNTVLFNVYANKYRESILSYWTVHEILDCTAFKLFESAEVRNIIFTFTKNGDSKFIGYRNTFSARSFEDLLKSSRVYFKIEELQAFSQNWGLAFKLPEEIVDIVNKTKKNKTKLVESNPEISQGLIAYDAHRGQSKEIIENRVFHHTTYREGLKKWILGEDVTRYKVEFNNQHYIDYCEGIANPRDPKFFINNRVLIREITNPRIFAAYTNQELYNDPSVLIVKESDFGLDMYSLTAILNSDLITFYHFNNSPKATKGSFPKIILADLKELPIVIPNEKYSFILKYLVKFIVELNMSNKFHDLMCLFDQLVDAIVFELYFPEQIKCTGKDVLRHLIDIKPITKEMTEEEKLAIIQSEYDRLSHPSHPVRIAIDTLDEVEEVRIIRDALNR